MEISNQFIKMYPSYEEVFYGEMDSYKKHFLPICSINLQCIEPTWDEWLHIVSVKEIGEGSVGEATESFHTAFTLENQISFDVIDGKYKFDTDFGYFQFDGEAPDFLKETYETNERDYLIRKEYFMRHHQIYPISSLVNEFTSLEQLEMHVQERQSNDWELTYPEVNGFLEELNRDIEEDQEFFGEDESFIYIGSVKGYYFQAYGANYLSLYYNKQLKKAVITFD